MSGAYRWVGELVVLQGGRHLFAVVPRSIVGPGELGQFSPSALALGGPSCWCGWCLDCGLLVVIPAASMHPSHEGPHPRHG